METEIFELIQKIRGHINRTEKMASLLPDNSKWLPLTSALDVLEDSSGAVNYYIESTFPENVNGKYLFIYGLIQALFLQMDAANSIQKALTGSIIDFEKDYPDAYRVREMRNDVVGHPTNRKNKQSIYLVQVSLNKHGFYYVKDSSVSGTIKGESISVSVDKAIEEVNSCIKSVLEQTISALDEEFIEYINLHRGRKMREIFNELDYAREKVLLEDSSLSDWGYNAAKEMAKKCENEVIRRYGSLEAFDSYNYLLKEIYEICDLIDNGLPQMPIELRSKSKKYFLECLFSKLEELETYAKETDLYFETYGEN